MAQEAEAFIALPGGYGTMEELLEMITWSQLGIHKKTVGLLNVDGYYNNLLALFDTGVEEGLIKPVARNILVSGPTSKELMEKMEQYNPSHKHVASLENWKVEQLGDYPGQQENNPQSVTPIIKCYFHFLKFCSNLICRNLNVYKGKKGKLKFCCNLKQHIGSQICKVSLLII